VARASAGMVCGREVECGVAAGRDGGVAMARAAEAGGAGEKSAAGAAGAEQQADGRASRDAAVVSSAGGREGSNAGAHAASGQRLGSGDGGGAPTATANRRHASASERVSVHYDGRGNSSGGGSAGSHAGGSAWSGEGSDDDREAGRVGEPIGCVGDTTVWVRAAVVAKGRGEAVWRAGRRGDMVRLRDVELVAGRRRRRVGASGRRRGDRGASGVSGAAEYDGEEERSRGGAVEAVVVEAGAAKRGRYAVGSRWHEGTMVLKAVQMGSIALQWRYGDG
jgi:hypothetical protein